VQDVILRGRQKIAWKKEVAKDHLSSLHFMKEDAVVHSCGDRLSRKSGNVGEFDSC